MLTVSPGSIPNAQRANDAVFDEPNEVVRAGIVPAQVLSAAAALAEGPRMPRKPGVFEGCFTALPAAEGPGEGDDPKADAHRVGEGEFVLTLIPEPVPFMGHPAQAPSAKPIAGRVGKTCGCNALWFHFDGGWRWQLDFG